MESKLKLQSSPLVTNKTTNPPRDHYGENETEINNSRKQSKVVKKRQIFSFLTVCNFLFLPLPFFFLPLFHSDNPREEKKEERDRIGSVSHRPK